MDVSISHIGDREHNTTLQGSMKRQRWIIPVFVWSLAFGMPLAAWAEIPPVFVELSQAVHFLDTQGQDLVATSGTYRVEAHETWLTLIPADGKSTLQLATTAGTHKEALTAPLVLSIPLGSARAQAQPVRFKHGNAAPRRLSSRRVYQE